MCATSRFLRVLLIAVFAAGGLVGVATASSGGSRDCPCDGDVAGDGSPTKYCNADEEGTPCTYREDCPDGQECVTCFPGPDGWVDLECSLHPTAETPQVTHVRVRFLLLSEKGAAFVDDVAIEPAPRPAREKPPEDE